MKRRSSIIGILTLFLIAIVSQGHPYTALLAQTPTFNSLM